MGCGLSLCGTARDNAGDGKVATMQAPVGLHGNVMLAVTVAASLLLAGGCDRRVDDKRQATDAGPRFAMLDASGEPMPATASGHHCVLDHRTTLVWEVKQAEGLHRSDQTYTWYSEDKAMHMSEPGEPAGGNCDLDRCDTQSFVEAVNRAGLCGSHDWRLPTREEVVTLGDRRWLEQGLAIDPAHFPGTVPGEHWTGTTFRLYPKTAWAFDTRYALDRADWKSAAKPVRLVRGPLDPTPRRYR
jgi:hypothetical protein